jgi:hypothetical protein
MATAVTTAYQVPGVWMRMAIGEHVTSVMSAVIAGTRKSGGWEQWNREPV